MAHLPTSVLPTLCPKTENSRKLGQNKKASEVERLPKLWNDYSKTILKPVVSSPVAY
jgi:hypothetical protein